MTSANTLRATAAGLLFCSGFSALVYQTVWMREFRLVFGGSTFATAAVLSIFMAGLGGGSFILGRRVDVSRWSPLAFYGALELGIALTAAGSPLLLILVGKAYIAFGGVAAMGLTMATALRLILAVLVMGVPTFLMGGTLPAAARAVEVNTDDGRRRVAVLYGFNTLGAVAGVLVSTFYMLEHLGNRSTLLTAAALNVAVGAIAILVGRERSGSPPSRESSTATAALPRSAVLISSALVGFVFLLMELVWYRILTPVLGGTTFTFGLILAIALLGIGLGGLAYSLWSGGSTPSPAVFAMTCSLEAVALIAPYAVGDRLAVFANLLRSTAVLGFGGEIIGWTLIASFVVFPAALISGIQFPILIAMLGRGRDGVGRHVGMAYAWNTGGAIAGSLAGGFGLMPLLSAPGCWSAAASALAGLAVATSLFAVRRRHFVAAAAVVMVSLGAVVASRSTGPTAVWRHTGIGAGRAPELTGANDIRAWIRDARRSLRWQGEGRESSIAVLDADDRIFMMNGKADGSARGDAGTQVMAGMIGAMIHPDPRRALVIGLGTGSTAGWLAAIPSMERVDAVELEPFVLRVAHDNAAVNHDAMRNPKLQVRIGDAREVLLTSRKAYDIIFSEPSNPYRAGIASLFTAEFYGAAAARLRPHGIFLQWVQAYDIDNATLRTIYATLGTAFPHVDTWQTTDSDLLLVASKDPVVYEVDEINRRLQRRPYADAMHHAWRMETAEGFFSNFIGSEAMAAALGARAELNTDDRTLIEFGFARSLHEEKRLDLDQLAAFAAGVNAARPARMRGTVNWRDVDLNRWHDASLELPTFNVDPFARARVEFTKRYDADDLQGALLEWRDRTWNPVNSLEESRLAEVLAEAGVEDAVARAERLRKLDPAEADAIVARTRLRQRRFTESAAALEQAFIRYRTDPWPEPSVMGRALDTAVTLARTDASLAPRLLDALSQPFAAGQWSQARTVYRVQIAHAAFGCGQQTIAALVALEPEFPWTYDLLQLRQRCYQSAGLGRLADRAAREWQEYLQEEPKPLAP